jgi:hypothetical protein
MRSQDAKNCSVAFIDESMLLKDAVSFQQGLRIPVRIAFVRGSPRRGL